jgi:DNA-binding GntR family transcriptional regulator
MHRAREGQLPVECCALGEHDPSGAGWARDREQRGVPMITAPLNLDRLEAPSSLRTTVRDALRASVIAGEMSPGVIYSAPSLARRFGISATPVREAMLDLMSEGLMEVVRNKGFHVKKPLTGELDDITQLRLWIEVPAVASIATRVDPSMSRTFDELEQCVTEIERLADHGDLIQYLELDRHFHLTLLGLTDNELLIEIVGNLRSRARLYGMREIADRGELGVSAREHRELLASVRAGEAAKAKALIRRHIGHTRGVWAGFPEDGE